MILVFSRILRKLFDSTRHYSYQDLGKHRKAIHSIDQRALPQSFRHQMDPEVEFPYTLDRQSIAFPVSSLLPRTDPT